MNFGNIMQKKKTSQYCLLFLCLLLLASPLPVKAEAKADSVTLTVEQVFTKNSSAAGINDSFSYELTALAPGNPMPPGSAGGLYSFAITGTNSIDIDPLVFSHVGIYLYEIKMNPPSPAAGYDYDTQIYQIHIFVKQTDDTFSAEMIVEKSDGSKTDNILFKNTYTPLASNPDLMTDLSVRKTISGDVPNQPADFTFCLTARDTANPMPAGSTDGIKKIVVTGAGENTFGTWSYSREGTYYYDITEENLRNTGYTYDEAVYTIIDTVKDVDGQLVVTRIATNEGNKPVSAFLFINKYKRKQTGGGSGGGSSVRPAVPGTIEVIPETIVDSLVTEGTEPSIDNQDGIDADAGIPKVGDEGQYGFYIMLLFACIIILIGCIIYLLLRSNNRTKKLARNIAILLSISICLMLFSGKQLWKSWQSYQAADQSYDDLRQQVRQPEREYFDDTKDSLSDTPRIDFTALKQINADAAAWLYGPETVIDYPVMAADEYNWYLHHLPDGTENANGSLFLDYNGEDDFTGRLNIIYGHHMKSGQMFGSLKGYKKQEYFQQHPELYLYTEAKNYRIDLKYGCVIPAGEWREQAFMYDINLDELLAYAASRTTFVSDTEYTDTDKFIVLATCSYEFEDARYLVIGILREENEAAISD